MITVIFFSLLLHAVAFVLLIRHTRAERRHHLPVIGSDLKLTEALHTRLKANTPASDWLHPTTLRAKIAAWLRRDQDKEMGRL